MPDIVIESMSRFSFFLLIWRQLSGIVTSAMRILTTLIDDGLGVGLAISCINLVAMFPIRQYDPTASIFSSRPSCALDIVVIEFLLVS